MRWLRSPLLHFLLGGAVLFRALHGAAPAPAPVVVSAADVARLRSDYARETGLEPTAADEAALVQKAIDEELLFREAVARGLDQHDRSVRNWLIEQMRVLTNDPDGDADALYDRARALGLDRSDVVVRRILVQKMRLIAARSGEEPPSDAALRAYYSAHQDEYRMPARVSFWHVFLAAAAHGDATVADANRQLARFDPAEPPDHASRYGETYPAPPHVVAASPEQIEARFGADVRAAVAAGELHRWLGPVRSPYGAHLIWIEAREPGAVPAFAAVRQRVLERWQDEQRARRVGALLDTLARRYAVRVESASWRQRRGA
jgi:hypothetical protein